ncbi:hypothetical protein ACFQ8O_25595 [Streptomyces coelicoflavus]|uniref:hypothetical protein n=1 Tax=Streptomyces coelicoflavus TaxID=285562 RepID=UPI003699D6DE
MDSPERRCGRSGPRTAFPRGALPQGLGPGSHRDHRLGLPPGQARFLFRPSSHARGTNTVPNFLARANKPPGTPPLVIGRARATWLVDAIEARMHLPTLMAAAGLTALRSIDRVLPHVRILSPDQAAAALKEL